MIKTEQRNPDTMHIDRMSTLDMLKIINKENMNTVNAVEAALPQIEKAVDAITDALKKGGRLFYIGAGTSGRLGVADAAECPPTFGVSPELVKGIIAGGDACMTRAAEGEEDDAEAGERDLLAQNITENDVIVGISASGGPAYVLAALKKAKELGCITVSITSNAGSPMDSFADIPICADTGAEVVTGSTRMKAGTAQKLILNMLSTCTMIKLGMVYENLMINLRPTNLKLTDRMIRIVEELTGADRETAKKLLDEKNWNIKESVDSYKNR